MMASRLNPGNNNDDDDDEGEGESVMPGDYEPWPRAASRATPSTTVRPPPRPSVPPISRSRRQPPPAVPSSASPRRRRPIPPPSPPIRQRRSRQRPLTPKIVIERRSRHHRSSGRDRVMRIPLDNRPTLGLRGPPKRVLEIERVRCRRRRRSKPTYYEDDYDTPPPPPQPQSYAVVANPIANPCLPPVQSSLMTSNSAALFSNLTSEMIQNLPRHTVHLPPIHLPGSQADANTELHTVIFPAEIINPIDGTLSIIQTNPPTNASGDANTYPSVTVPTQPQLMSMPTNVGTSMVMPTIASGPWMQQIRNHFQQFSIPQTQASSPLQNPPFIQPSLPVMTAYNSTNNAPYNPQTVLRMNTTNTGPYSSANIRPTSTPHIGPYRSTTFSPANPTNPTPYRLPNSTPYRPPNAAPSSPANIQPYRPVSIGSFNLPDIGPYLAANITPYSAAPNRSVGNSRLPGATPYILSSASINSSPLAYSSSSNIGISSLHASNSSQTPYQSGNTMPKSILRNTPFNTLSNTTYSRLNPPIVSSSNNIVRKKTIFT
jgi:hypothetical protein